MPNNLIFELELWSNKFNLIAGIDEAGRGPIAGPLVASAVILKKWEVLDAINNDVIHSKISLYKEINDSKKISANKRAKLFNFIISRALSYSIVEIPACEIDEKGIAEVNSLAFLAAVKKLKIRPDFIITDFFVLKNHNYSSNQLNLIKGDMHSISVGAASILAKVHRDRLMTEYHTKFPVYGFNRHKGYPTALHKEMISRHGTCELHRKSFNLGLVR